MIFIFIRTLTTAGVQAEAAASVGALCCSRGSSGPVERGLRGIPACGAVVPRLTA